MSDTNIEQFLPIFAKTGVPVAFLVPTPTGFGKSIMDATAPIRELLRNSCVHDYDQQSQGQNNKEIVDTYIVRPDSLIQTDTSLYRPETKKGDPRIWIYNLKPYCQPCNLLALIVIERKIYVFNLSDRRIADSLFSKGFCYNILEEASHKDKLVSEELLNKLHIIHNRGFIPSITPGDPGVGDTLEHALGIERNNSKAPDYKGIELKTTRLTRNGGNRTTTRSTLFTRVPDEGMSYRQIVDAYGKVQVPRGSTEARLQMYETLMCARVNAYDLILEVDVNNDKLNIMHQEERVRKYVSAWYLENLRKALLLKHHETFWVKAQSETRGGIEFFRYDKVLHTKNPNASLLAPLFEANKITVDLAAHYKPDGKWRDHGVLFKMMPDDLPLLLGEPKEYIL
ncbi:MvaI/BcnI family restriction endonuclease [Mediterraneibacter gnavus]|uniref:MvaI/BcnI family restriction endonuclease n=1 Tax=Mediterraneibacter gnavus TaxID=33038 RepID=UPI001FA70561|nr:MvaI/BcnI family restriction endonuclease [Mediterraneibacter gnavus]MCZ0677803.1 MvaI/BcnI family restriction endonuclease [Mediterraneibacter gnavus]MDB8705184.1 MvaI/BcnI family restriction endonuclease [Mediterraneibacter gnavus]MDB8717887.1 MvaI/BcnI family restriction endonuclease [Mediterraneibacter gnavus]